MINIIRYGKRNVLRFSFMNYPMYHYRIQCHKTLHRFDISFQCLLPIHTKQLFMMPSWNGDASCNTGLLWGKYSSYAELWCIICCLTAQYFEQILQFGLIWDAVSLMWRHCNVLSVFFMYSRQMHIHEIHSSVVIPVYIKMYNYATWMS